jgi:hypothetical protein
VSSPERRGRGAAVRQPMTWHSAARLGGDGEGGGGEARPGGDGGVVHSDTRGRKRKGGGGFRHRLSGRRARRGEARRGRRRTTAMRFGHGMRRLNTRAARVWIAPPTAANQGAAQGDDATDQRAPHISVFFNFK